MPGKQTGMSGTCWPDRLIDDLPNVYLYASNNPSEGAIAKRRSGATLISYLTPPIAQAGLYKGLNDLKSSLERWRSLERGNSERAALAVVIQAQAAELDLVSPEPIWDTAMGQALDQQVLRLSQEMLELEYTLIPHGLHVAGRAPSLRAGAVRQRGCAGGCLQPRRGQLRCKASMVKDQGANGVEVMSISDSTAPARRVYEPNHPKADGQGFVTYSNVNPVEEMVNMISASRSYQMNLEAMNSARELMQRSLDILGT
jgi:flagellar basal-body rod protein FlgC